MRGKVVGVAILFPVLERANGSCDNFDTKFSIDLLVLVSEACG